LFDLLAALATSRELQEQARRLEDELDKVLKR
jgi:hypothetical protein